MTFFFFNDTATTEIYTLSLHDALPIFKPSNVPVCKLRAIDVGEGSRVWAPVGCCAIGGRRRKRSEEHTSELQSRQYLVCRLLLEKKTQYSSHILLLTLSEHLRDQHANP